jgi:hypothetical protein
MSAWIAVPFAVVAAWSFDCSLVLFFAGVFLVMFYVSLSADFAFEELEWGFMCTVDADEFEKLIEKADWQRLRS